MIVKAIKFIITLVTAALLSAFTAAAAVAVSVLLSSGVLSILTALGGITGLIGYAASDLAPPTMLFTGFFCVSAAASLGISLYILCPIGVRRFNNTIDNIFK